MIKTYCNVCFQTKEPERITEYLCGTCQTRADEALENAHREGTDPYEARRLALESRTPHPMGGHRPNQYFPRVQGMQ